MSQAHEDIQVLKLVWGFKTIANAPPKKQLDLPGMFPTAEEIIEEIRRTATTFSEWRSVYGHVLPLSDLCTEKMALLARDNYELETSILYLDRRIRCEPYLLRRDMFSVLPWGIGPYEETLRHLLSGDSISSELKKWVRLFDLVWQRVSVLSLEDYSLTNLARCGMLPWRAMADLKVKELQRIKRDEEVRGQEEARALRHKRGRKRAVI